MKLPLPQGDFAGEPHSDKLNFLHPICNLLRRSCVQQTHMAGTTGLLAGQRSPVTCLGGVRSDRFVPYETASEAEVVRRAKGGDEEAFALIVQQHQNMVYSLALRMVRRSIDAEDVAQQVFTKVFFALKKFDMRSSLSTWIYKIAMNETYDYLRRLKSRRVVFEGDLGENVDEIVESSARAADTAPSAEEQTSRRDYLLKLLEHVSEEERMLLFQKEVEGLTVDELAVKTGINENTIKVKLFRARKKLVKAAQQLRTDEPGEVL